MRAIWVVVVMSVRVSPWQSVASLGAPAALVLRLLQPLFLAWLVTGVIEHELRGVVTASVCFIASVGIRGMLDVIGYNARMVQLERVGAAFDKRIAEITARIPTLDHLESARYLDELKVLRDEQGSLGLALNMLLNSVSNIAMVGGTLGLALTADWRLLLVAAAGLPGMVASRWLIRWRAAAENESAEPGRLSMHLLDLGVTPVAGAELRVFGLESSMRAGMRAATASWRAPLVRLARKEAAVDVLGTTFFFGVAAAVLAWMVRDTIGGALPLSSLVLAVMLVSRLQSASDLIRGTARSLSQMIRTANRFLSLLDYDQDVRNAHAGTRQPPARLSQSIRIDRLSYTYPDAETPSLVEVSLDLPAGSVVALVGENGAGKSTLVKVLTGMYRPTGGRVLVDDVELADLDLDAWRARLSGAFQDHARFELLAREVVGLGDLPHIHNDERVHGALRSAASEAVLTALPEGLDTQLGPQWTDGVDLSGGQWQRLAIARGMMRDAPLLLVLDEPTAALDAATEHALFERYAAAARATGRRGGVTLLVTHRFSTVAAADLVVVLDRGRVVETGTHTSLLRAGGQYAELYELQARGYR